MGPRIFKTKWFAKAARKAGVSDAALGSAIAEVACGRAVDLGGGVFKKRLNDNHLRAIILARAGEFWVFEYLFAKSDRANIDSEELQAFRTLAKAYGNLAPLQVQQLIDSGHWKEIENGHEV
jgi:hypothetical protein